MKLAAIAGLAMIAATPTFAQSTDIAPKIVEPGPPRVTTPGQPPEAVIQGGGSANSGPGATQTLVRSGTGADNASTDTAATTNSSDPSRAVPKAGGGGGGEGGGN